MKRNPSLLVLVLLGGMPGACSSPEPTVSSPPAVTVGVEHDGPINEHCPRSGKPVAEDSLTEYRGYVVGFCNTHCRDDFAAHVAERPQDTTYFDAVIAGLETSEPATD